MKTELNVMERLTLLGLMPKEGSFVTLKLSREFVANIGFTEEEIKGFEINESDGKVQWNTKGQQGKEFEFGAKSTELISGVLKKLDSEKKLSPQHYTLYEKFVGVEEA